MLVDFLGTHDGTDGSSPSRGAASLDAPLGFLQQKLVSASTYFLSEVLYGSMQPGDNQRRREINDPKIVTNDGTLALNI